MGVGIAKAAVAAGHEGHIRAGGVDKDVTFVFVDADITKRSTPPTEPSTTATTTATSRP
jgi:hypothetical protein